MPSLEALDDLLAAERLTLTGLLYEVMSGLNERILPQLAEHGLTEVEFGVLLRLARSPHHRLRMTDLTAQTSLTNSGITRVVDRLAREGLVRREASPTDRRGIYAVVTTGGRERLAAALPGHLDLVQQWLVDPLPADDVASFCAGLRILRDRLRPDATAGADGHEGDRDEGEPADLPVADLPVRV